MNPFDTNPLKSPVPAGLDPYRTFFVARLTAKERVGDVWRYAWAEQTFDRATGLPTDANPRRSGTADNSPAVEVNNVALDLSDDVYVFMRQKGVVRGQTYYEFCAGAGVPLDDGSDGTSGPCSDTGFLTALDGSDCLTAALNGGPATAFGSGIVINGVTYTATLDASARTLTLSAGGSGGAIVGKLGCETCKCATFLFKRSSFFSEPLPADSCNRLLRVTVCQTCCTPLITADGWYCVRDAGTSYPCAAVHLTVSEDACRSDVAICSGPYASRAEAEANCPSTVDLVPADQRSACLNSFMAAHGWTAAPRVIFLNFGPWTSYAGGGTAGCAPFFGSRMRLEWDAVRDYVCADCPQVGGAPYERDGLLLCTSPAPATGNSWAFQAHLNEPDLGGPGFGGYFTAAAPFTGTELVLGTVTVTGGGAPGWPSCGAQNTITLTTR